MEDAVHPKTGQAMRVSYAMYRAFYAAMDEQVSGSTSFEAVPDRMLALLRSWGIEVVELPSWPFMPGPPTDPSWPEDGDD